MQPYDERSAGEILRQRGWRTAFAVEERVGAWASLVGVVEQGYDDMVEEYTNDLYCRNWLHEAWLLLPAQSILRWTPRISALDERFRAATVFDDGIALSRLHGIRGFDPVDMWWWRRHPRLMVGDLGAALRGVGAAG